MIEIKKQKNKAVALDGEKEVGLCEYREEDGKWILYHTFVEKEYGGQGIALTLLECLVEEARKEGKKIIPQCSYVRHVFEKNKDKYIDIIAPLPSSFSSDQ